MCVCACVRACACACVRACVCERSLVKCFVLLYCFVYLRVVVATLSRGGEEVVNLRYLVGRTPAFCSVKCFLFILFVRDSLGEGFWLPKTN